MPIFQVPQAVTAIVDLMTAYIEVHFGEVNAIAGIYFKPAVFIIFK